MYVLGIKDKYIEIKTKTNDKQAYIIYLST